VKSIAESSDLELVRAGDTDTLVRRHYGPVLTLVRRLLGDTAAAGDAAQETFTRAIAHLGQFDFSGSFRAWLFTIAANHVRDLLRRRKAAPLDPGVQEELPDLSLPDDRMLLDERRELLSVAVDRLPFDLKIVVVLQFQQGLSTLEAAEVLGVSVNAIRIRLYRALKALREGMS
jgi:RNA polymerase sigma-70 factor (ECF subfamily)